MAQDPLDPLPDSFVPFDVGEKVAFKEDHPTYPGMYGIVLDVGVSNGQLMFDVEVIDPKSDEQPTPPETARLTMEDIQ